MRLMVVTTGLGEWQAAQFTEQAARNLGWQCQLYLMTGRKTRHVEELKHQISKFHPDFVLVTKYDLQPVGTAPCYVVFSLPHEYYGRQRDSDSMARYSHFAGILPGGCNRDRLEAHLTRYNTNILPFSWHATVHSRQRYVSRPNTLFCCGANWDDSRRSAEFVGLFQRLASEGYLNVFGPRNAWSHVSDAYRGFIPVDGESLLSTMSANGIVLVIHGHGFNAEAMPSGRIFEAAAAGCVIICDRNEFVEREFGDSVLFFDESGSAQDMYEQIDAHMSWIREHPVESGVLAKRAMTIFEDRFLLDDQLRRLADWHCRHFGIACDVDGLPERRA